MGYILQLDVLAKVTILQLEGFYIELFYDGIEWVRQNRAPLSPLFL